MHKESAVLDVGSFDVNGNFRNSVTNRGWHYTGLDMVAGPNVDVVALSEYDFPFEDNSFDIVMSGSTMEHVNALWLWIPELTRVLKRGGMLAIITHTHWPYHPHPVDCWRIMPDGMKFLFDLSGNLARYQIEMYCPTDISATAWKV
jgi:SAM-dependent methyltransferase